jgi:hypothetical protein
MTAKRHAEISLTFAYLAVIACSWYTSQPAHSDNFSVAITIASVAWLAYNCVTYIKRF